MALYSPPVTETFPPIYMGHDRYYPVPVASQRLFRHYISRSRGINVFKLVDGTYTDRQPPDSSLINTTYHGGHVYDVTSGELAALAAAGFPSS